MHFQLACTVEEEKKLDEELFDENASPYSLFRDVIGFFDDPMCCAKFKFRFMLGRVKDELDGTVTHVFVDDETDATSNRQRAKTLQSSAKIVTCKWIEQCFRSGRLCEITDYLVC